MTKPDGGPAFPQCGWKYAPESGRYVESISGGMSLRDYFAGHVLSLQTYAGSATTQPSDYQIANLAETAYRIADAMIAAREAQK
jgi:hypothetical protein